MTAQGMGSCEGAGVGLAPIVGDAVAETPGGSGDAVGETVLRGAGAERGSAESGRGREGQAVVGWWGWL